ncbi:MAG: AEC family transporter [Caldimonas sp.]
MSSLVIVKLLVIFLVVGAGWLAGRLRLLGDGDPARTLSYAAFYIFVPALLFRTTARIDFHQLDATVLLAFFLPTLALLAVVYTTQRLRGHMAIGRAAWPSVRGISAVFGNSVQIGIPFAAALYGDTGLAIHVTIVSLHALILLTLLTALVEIDLARERHRTDPGHARLWHLLGTTARNTVIHPVVLPVLAGLAFNIAGIVLPGLADDFLATLGLAVVPLCLVLIGVSLAQYGVRGAVRGAAALSVVKLLVHPLLVFIAARFGFGLGGVPLAVVVMMAALPVGSNALVFAQRYDTLKAETSAAIVFSTLGFVVTAPLWLAVLAALG